MKRFRGELLTLACLGIVASFLSLVRRLGQGALGRKKNTLCFGPGRIGLLPFRLSHDAWQHLERGQSLRLAAGKSHIIANRSAPLFGAGVGADASAKDGEAFPAAPRPRSPEKSPDS